jgi:hypothetical protein
LEVDRLQERPSLAIAADGQEQVLSPGVLSTVLTKAGCSGEDAGLLPSLSPEESKNGVPPRPIDPLHPWNQAWRS